MQDSVVGAPQLSTLLSGSLQASGIPEYLQQQVLDVIDKRIWVETLEHIQAEVRPENQANFLSDAQQITSQDQLFSVLSRYVEVERVGEVLLQKTHVVVADFMQTLLQAATPEQNQVISEMMKQELQKTISYLNSNKQG